MEEILRLENIYKIFKTKKEKFTAVKNLNFSLKKGESLGVLGESGCGKSTLARMIIGIEDVSSGKIFLNDLDITKISSKREKNIRRKIQIVFQNPMTSFSPRMIVGEYLYEPLKNYDKLSRDEAIPIIKNYLEKVGLPTDCLEKYPHEFSGGQLQRIAIARALLAKPEIIICDEATSALDATVQKKILELLKTLQKELGISYIFIGHDIAVVQDISDRVIIIKEGEVVEELTSENIKNAEHPYTKLLLNSIFEI